MRISASTWCVCVGGPCCASHFVCVWGALLVPQTWSVCGGLFLCLQLVACVGRPYIAADCVAVTIDLAVRNPPVERRATTIFRRHEQVESGTI